MRRCWGYNIHSVPVAQVLMVATGVVVPFPTPLFSFCSVFWSGKSLPFPTGWSIGQRDTPNLVNHRNSFQRRKNVLISVTLVGCCCSNIASTTLRFHESAKLNYVSQVVIQSSEKNRVFNFGNTLALHNWHRTFHIWCKLPSTDYSMERACRIIQTKRHLKESIKFIMRH